VSDMTDTNPITPDPPIPPGQDVEAPDIEFEPPDGRAVPDGMAVNEDAAATEAPD
jgi:hypothetical protein